ncbi:hypothetical protein D3C84_1011520 [compost metagenome]
MVNISFPISCFSVLQCLVAQQIEGEEGAICFRLLIDIFNFILRYSTHGRIERLRHGLIVFANRFTTILAVFGDINSHRRAVKAKRKELIEIHCVFSSNFLF